MSASIRALMYPFRLMLWFWWCARKAWWCYPNFGENQVWRVEEIYSRGLLKTWSNCAKLVLFFNQNSPLKSFGRLFSCVGSLRPAPSLRSSELVASLWTPSPLISPQPPIPLFSLLGFCDGGSRPVNRGLSERPSESSDLLRQGQELSSPFYFCVREALAVLCIMPKNYLKMSPLYLHFLNRFSDQSFIIVIFLASFVQVAISAFVVWGVHPS